MDTEYKKLYAYLIKLNIIGDNPVYELKFYEKKQKENQTITRCEDKDFIQEFEKLPCCKGCGGE